jgi:hypothetical protein
MDDDVGSMIRQALLYGDDAVDITKFGYMDTFAFMAGRCTLTLSSPRLKRLEVSA